MSTCYSTDSSALFILIALRMNHLLPFPASVPESGVVPRQLGSGPTLTLPLALTPVHAAFEPAMSGSVRIDDTAGVAGSLLRAAVLPADGPVLTITF